jgi:DNA adenine methylase|tara:strand:+ start:1069 stop:1785 length:717 start_codon:yes stop_codon:yes gene_type:complete
MKYMGSKNRIAKHILPIILKDRKEGQWYVEPFFGGGNSMQHVSGNRICGEINPYISAMWNSLIGGWCPKKINKDEYKEIKANKSSFCPEFVGWAGVACSYSGKWFGGFAGQVETKEGLRDYQAEAFENVKKQLPKLKGLFVTCSSYESIETPENSIIYCDPPYEGTTKYKDSFDHVLFWGWIRGKVKGGHRVFISEYNAPEDFVSLWSQEIKSSLSANGKVGGSKNSVEKLFIHESQA